ncbi:hypothetical protein PanWU01x14_243800 [Parasponia andersonii]|uniref:Uncharacterized protein n=1 Tax=Parasponia andersonii TaxID=3476 RepID=A0A2P5BFF3_PARAD|nr:hypothetical protein PanWU01x14_243800 [Parasponia andersonii]
MSVAISVDTPCGVVSVGPRNIFAQKRGDIAPCRTCPLDLTIEMQEHLNELSLERESKQKRKREMLEDMRRKKVRNNPPPPPPPPQEEVAGDVDAEERDLLDQAIKESLQTDEIEEKKSKTENYEFFQACPDSLQSYELEQKKASGGFKLLL